MLLRLVQKCNINTGTQSYSTQCYIPKNEENLLLNKIFDKKNSLIKNDHFFPIPFKTV